MGKSRPPRKRKPAAAESVATPPVPAEPEVPAEPSHEIVVHRGPSPPVAPILAQVVETLRLVAGRMIDIADAAADAVKKRIEGRA
jgi:hypothetical protein